MTADRRAFPWAEKLDADQLAAFLEELWGAASGDDDLNTLKAVEDVIATWRLDVGVQAEPDVPCPLSEDQVKVLTQLANGETHRSASRILGVPLSTVRNQLAEIYTRLGVRNTVQAAAVAAHHRWLPDMLIPALIDRPPVHGPHAWRDIYRERVAEMRDQPGKPVEIGPYTSYSGSHNAAWRIRYGLIPEFQPAGEFHAQAVLTEPGRWMVIARYLGESNEQQKAAS